MFKKFILITIAMFMTFMIYAQSPIEVLNIDSTVIMKTNDESVYLYETKDTLISLLKKHSEALATIESQKIYVTKSVLTGTFKANNFTNVDFRFVVNTIKDKPYLFSIVVNNGIAIYLTSTELNSLITDLESYKSKANQFLEQHTKLDAIIKEVMF